MYRHFTPKVSGDIFGPQTGQPHEDTGRCKETKRDPMHADKVYFDGFTKGIEPYGGLSNDGFIHADGKAEDNYFYLDPRFKHMHPQPQSAETTPVKREWSEVSDSSSGNST